MLFGIFQKLSHLAQKMQLLSFRRISLKSIRKCGADMKNELCSNPENVLEKLQQLIRVDIKFRRKTAKYRL